MLSPRIVVVWPLDEVLRCGNAYSMYTLCEMRVARRLLCSGRAWAATASFLHETNAIRSVLYKRGNGAIQTTLEASPCLHQTTRSRSVIWEHYYLKSLENLQRASGLKTCTWTFLGFSYATSFLAASEQGAIHCHDGVVDGFNGSRQAPEISEIIAVDSLETEPYHKLLNFIKRYWWPTVFLLTVIVGYPYPKSLLPNTLLLMWSTKPHPASIYLWLRKRRETSQVSQGALDQMKNKLNSAATVMHVEVQDYMFCLAKVTYLTSNATMVGVLGGWWIVYSSSSRITALGLSLDSVPNLDNLAKDFRSKKEELEAEIKKVTEDGLKKYKTWIEKQL